MREARPTMSEESGASQKAGAELLAAEAEALRDAGAPEERWMPLVERGLAQCAERRDTTWARLTLVAPPPMKELFSGRIYAGRWLGPNPEAVRILRSNGSEEDYARTLWVYERRTIDETRALLERARSWVSPAAAIRGVSVAAENAAVLPRPLPRSACCPGIIAEDERGLRLARGAGQGADPARPGADTSRRNPPRAGDGRAGAGRGGKPGPRANALRARGHHQGRRHVSGPVHGRQLRHVPRARLARSGPALGGGGRHP